MEDWRDRALCTEVDMDLFFPESFDYWGSVAAKRICAGCEVKAECLDFALRKHITQGIWGGTSERERRKLRKERRLAAA